MKEIVAKRIKSARGLAGLSLRELSEKLDGLVSYNAISKYEKDSTLIPFELLKELSELYQVKLDDIF